jgi:hypothetical protein
VWLLGTYLLAAVILAIGVWGLMLFRIKAMLLGRLKGEYRPATFEEFPNANLALIRQRTSEFEALGFVRIADFATVRNFPVAACSRLLFNMEARCSATIIQLSSRHRHLGTNSVISSDLGTDWSVGHADYRPLAASWPMRHPRIIGRMLPGASVADVLSDHLKLREQVARDLGLPVVPPVSYEAHLISLQRGVAERRKILEGKSALVCVFDYLSAKFRPRYEWLGDYPVMLAQRKVA